MELPIKIQAIIYTGEGDSLKVLLIKRIEQDGGFWQTVTGGLKDGEKLDDAVRREVLEETGMKHILSVSEPIYEFEWKRNGKTMSEYVYAVKVAGDERVTLAPNEHDDYKWLKPSEAMSLFKHQSSKDALQKLLELI